MNLSKLQFCILSRTEEYLAYEKALYKAFQTKSPAHWILKNYAKIGQDRLRPLVEYSNMLIATVKSDEGSIVAGRAINLNMNETQIESTLHNELRVIERDNSAEALHMFCTGEGLESLRILSLLNEKLKATLVSKGIKLLYGVCFREHKRLFEVMGMTAFGRGKHEGVDVWLMKEDLVNSS
jgi:hypothetical protein